MALFKFVFLLGNVSHVSNVSYGPLVCVLLDVSPCVVEPCHNNGTCIRQGMTQNYTCICALGYTGDKCQSGNS